MANQDNARKERFRRLTDSSLDRLSGYVRWTTTVVTGAIVWIGSSLTDRPYPCRAFAIGALGSLLCSLFAALLIGFFTVNWRKAQQRAAKAVVELDSTKDLMQRSRPKNEPIEPEVAAILQDKTARYLSETESRGKWFRLAMSPGFLLFHLGTLFLGVFLYFVAQVL
jgi:hypothetical protein